MRVAAILATGELQRLYTGLSLLASGGPGSVGLATFASLPVLLDPDLRGRAMRPEAAPDLDTRGRERFALSLAELRDVVAPQVWACSAALECTGADRAAVEDRLAGVTSTPRFLSGLAADARLVVV